MVTVAVVRAEVGVADTCDEDAVAALPLPALLRLLTCDARRCASVSIDSSA